MAEKEYLENMQKIIDLTTSVPGGKILDVGCSEGTFTLRIAEKAEARFVYGMEIDGEKAKTAREKEIIIKESRHFLPVFIRCRCPFQGLPLGYSEDMMCS